MAPVFLAAAASALPLCAPAPARACSAAGPTPFVVDPSLQATDHVAPTLSPLSVAGLHRGKAMGACSGSSCDGMGSLGIAGTATDDVSVAGSIGYRFAVVTGTLPAGFTLPDGPSRVYVQDDTIWFSWDDGATDDQDDIDFTLSVVAIDAAGNESAPQTVRVSDHPGFGCAIARRRSDRDALVCLVVAAVTLATRRRRTR